MMCASTVLFKRLEEGRWSEGRPVYKRDRGSWGLDILGLNLAIGDGRESVLSIKEEFNSWSISGSTTSEGEWASKGKWIDGGQATNSPVSVNKWWYYDGTDWIEGGINVSCKTVS